MWINHARYLRKSNSKIIHRLEYYDFTPIFQMIFCRSVSYAYICSQRDRFEIYSEYCNNHPFAVSELQELYSQEKYVHFFEACRLLQEMIDISLDGFLLTPVQKICKYPLQLQELLKYTRPDHTDHHSVEGALSAMRGVALLINERKRRLECLEKIAAWQMNVEGWEGGGILERSSQLLHQGEVTKGAGSAWPKEVTLFLFDKQLIYCKKDIIKRNTFVYRGRINLDESRIEDVCVGDAVRGMLANCFKVHSHDKNKVYVFACKSSEDKSKWLEALSRERELVAQDQQSGFLVSDKTRQLALQAARNKVNTRLRPKKIPRGSKAHKRSQIITHAQAELLVNRTANASDKSNSLPIQPRGQQASILECSNGSVSNALGATTVSLPLADTTADSKKRGEAILGVFHALFFYYDFRDRC